MVSFYARTVMTTRTSLLAIVVLLGEGDSCMLTELAVALDNNNNSAARNSEKLESPLYIM